MRIPMILIPLLLISIYNAMSLAANSPQRGQLLYENHCTACHESIVHIRENHKANSLATVQKEVIRWSRVLNLGWQDVEIADVSQYLLRTFYSQALKNAN